MRHDALLPLSSIIKMIAKSLFQWEMPNLPEDLSFFKQGKVWLATSSHEKQCFIFPENETEASKIMGIEGLRVEEMDV